MPIVKVNDISVNYEINGQGEPLVLILGLASTIAENRWLIDSLAKKYKVLTFDNRGAGLTDKPDTPYSIEMMANDTACLMKELNFSQADIIGISMGGRVALELVLKYPEMINKLILVSTSAKVVHTWRRYFIFNILHRLSLFKDSQPHYAFVRQMEASGSYNAAGRLSEINVPTLILHGKSDRIAQYYLATEMHDGITDSKMVTFKGGHLFFMLGGRRPFLEAVTAFLG
jgi:pimeloyl-ACP methyl ester carboxylesterase